MKRYPATKPRGNTSYNGTRDRATQAAFRAMLIARDGLKCHECPTTTGLQAHHDTPTDGRMLCTKCHKGIDQHAR